MERTYLSEIKKRVGKQATVLGWVQTIRNQGAIKFLVLRDISGVAQAVVSEKNPQAAKAVKELTLESVVAVSGLVKEEKQAPGGVEIEVESIKILSLAAAPLPIQVVKKAKEPDREVRMDWRWIDLRKPKKQLIFKVWTAMEQAFREYWTSHGYIEIHSPKLMASPSESRAELFEVPYFGGKAYLAQSPQFYKQMAMAAGFEKVFEIGPVFRANPSFTSRHDTEFTSYDVEISFVESHQDIIQAEEEVLVAAIAAVKDKHGDEIKKSYGRELIVPSHPFPQVTMAEAKALLAKAKVPSERKSDLSPEEERKLCEIMREKTGHEFVFVTEWPFAARPFYHMRLESNPAATKSFDLLWNGMEVTTGAQREHRYEVLKKQAEEKSLDVKALESYLNFFKYGVPPHGGFGHGPTRMLMRIFGIDNVREVTYLYRGVKRLTP